MADMTVRQPSVFVALPHIGDFCDWHYGVTAVLLQQNWHGPQRRRYRRAVRNLGLGFYIAEIADNPRERADLEIANISQQNYLKEPTMVSIPDAGDIPIELCVSDQFPSDLGHHGSLASDQTKPHATISAVNRSTPWESTGVEMVEGGCSQPLATVPC